MKIKKVLAVEGYGGFFYDDQVAIRRGAVKDGDFYRGEPATRGFRSVRMPAMTLGIGLVTDAGFVAWGDGMSVQYSAAAGRDPVFDPAEQSAVVDEVVWPWLVDNELTTFRAAAEALAALRVDGIPLHTGLQYGLTQALLSAVARSDGLTMAEVICHDYDFPLVLAPVPIYCQSGDARQVNIDRMIMKRVENLPHGLINNNEKFGRRGEVFLEFLQWVANRVVELGGDGYRPTLHFDLYGSAGYAFGLSIPPIVEYLTLVEKAAHPFRIRIESPADFGSRDAQMEGSAALISALESRGCGVKIVADEWCNTLEDIELFVKARAAHTIQIKMPDLGGLQESIGAVRICHGGGVEAFLGGSCTETDLSARASVHVAVATQADFQLAKPGMGVDEGLMIVQNEQIRLLAELAARRTSRGRFGDLARAMTPR